ERAFRGRALPEVAVLYEDRLRALQELAGKAIDGTLPPDRDERGRARDTLERDPRDAVVLVAVPDDDEERRVRRPPDRGRVAHGVLAVGGRIARGDERQAAIRAEAGEVAGEARLV